MLDFDLKSQVSEVVNEILVYKWLESEKIGWDIGMKQATNDWISGHYDDWFDCNCKRFRLTQFLQ